MPVNTHELINAVAIISDNHNLKVCVKGSAKGGLIVGASAFVGSVLLGPVGLAVGGALGGYGAYRQAQGSYKSAATVLREELTERDKQMLADHVVRAFQELHPTDLAVIIPMLMSGVELQKIVLREVTGFLTNQMRMQIID